MKTMLIIAYFAFAIVTLAGCASEDVPSKCLRYGFTPHTDGFSNCMLQLDNQ